MMNKKAAKDLTISKLITIVLVVLVLVFLIWALAGFGIPKWIDDLLPNYGGNGEDIEYEYSELCPVKTAKVINNKDIEICADEECKTTRKTNLFIKDGTIWVYQTNDDEAGKVIRSNIIIFPEILKGVGSDSKPDLYFEVEADLPTYEDLLNLHLSYFFTKETLCRDFKTTEAKYRKEVASRELSISTAFISSGKLYFNADELLQNFKKSPTDLYLDSDLIQIAKSKIDSGENGYGINLEAEEGQDIPPGYSSVVTILTSTENSQTVQNLKEGQTISWKKLSKQIDNTHNKLGVNTGGDPLQQVTYTKKNGKVFIKLADDDNFGDDESIWILIDYWDAYQNFARVPRWARL